MPTEQWDSAFANGPGQLRLRSLSLPMHPRVRIRRRLYSNLGGTLYPPTP